MNYLSEEIPDYNYFEDIENFNTINGEDLLNEYTEEDDDDDDDDDDDNFLISINSRNNQTNENQRTSTPLIDDEDDAIWNRNIDENLNIILRRTDRNFILDVRNHLQSQIYDNQNNQQR